MGNAVSIVHGFFDQHLLLKALCLDLAIQWVVWPISFYYRTEKYFDLTGASTVTYISWVTLLWAKRGTDLRFFKRQIFQNFCVSVWAIRLGTFLYARSSRVKRFLKFKNDFVVSFKYWTIQGLNIYLTLLPTLIVNLKLEDKPMNLFDYIGYSLWLIGFFTEAIADYQKCVFRDTPCNRGKFITTGLWSVSRHPNYLGEIIIWFGLFLPASNTMEGWEYLSLASPLLVTYLLTNKTGLPHLERQADQRWGSLVEYQIYKNRTAKLFPFIW